MKVNYYFRQRSRNAYSIEKVFSTIASEVSKQHEVHSIEAPNSRQIFKLFTYKPLQADIHHITGAANQMSLALPAETTVLTVHDLGHLTLTLRGVKRALYKKLFWELPLKKIKWITAISEFTKLELVKTFNLKNDRIRTIYNPLPSGIEFVQRPQNEIPVILQIGSGTNKNVERLISSVEGMKCKILLVRPFSNDLHRMLTSYGIIHEFRSQLTDDEIKQAYIQSDLVFFASTYEGFGMPILEAMAVGRPVITSNFAPMTEVAGQHGIFVNPLSVQEIKDAIGSVLSSRDYYQEKVEFGLQQVKLFSPKQIAERYLELYNEVIAQ